MPTLPRSSSHLRNVLALAAVATLCAAGAARADTKIATVNTAKVLNALAETKDLQSALGSEKQTVDQQAQDREQKLKDLTAQRDQLKPDAPQWADLNKQLVAARSEAQAWYQTAQLELARKFREMAKRLNSKINTAVADVAKAKSIDIVIAEQKPEIPDSQVEQMKPEQYMSLLFAQNIPYRADSVDLTQDVITKLDSEYKKH